MEDTINTSTTNTTNTTNNTNTINNTTNNINTNNTNTTNNSNNNINTNNTNNNTNNSNNSNNTNNTTTNTTNTTASVDIHNSQEILTNSIYKNITSQYYFTSMLHQLLDIIIIKSKNILTNTTNTNNNTTTNSRNNSNSSNNNNTNTTNTNINTTNTNNTINTTTAIDNTTSINYSSYIIPTVLTSIVLVGLTITSIQTIYNYNEYIHIYNNAKYIPPPPPPSILLTANNNTSSTTNTVNIHICPICLQSPIKHATYTTSGQVYCHTCITEYVNTHSKCPMTNQYCTITDLIQLRV